MAVKQKRKNPVKRVFTRFLEGSILVIQPTHPNARNKRYHPRMVIIYYITDNPSILHFEETRKPSAYKLAGTR